MNILLLSAALLCPATALIVVGPILEIKPVGEEKYKSAEYVSCKVKSKADGDFFTEEVALKYKVPDDNKRFRELQFLGPLPPFANIEKCEVTLDRKTYQSDVYTKFRGDEMYENALETDTIVEVVRTGDLVYFRMKVSKDRKVKDIGIRIWWVQKPEIIHHTHLPSEKLYVFPRKAYFKFGSALPRSEASFVQNPLGKSSFEFQIDFNGVCGWSIWSEDDSEIKDKVCTITDSGRDGDIIFKMKMDREERISAKRFCFDGNQVVELSLVPDMEVLRKSILCDREVVLVVDKSGSMSWSNGGAEPYKLVSEAIEVFLSTVCDLSIYVNVVFFESTCGEDDVLFKGKSEMVSSESGILAKKDWVKDKAKPSGGTNILEGLRRAADLEPVTKDGKTLQRNIVLLTDGGDYNLKGITSLVQKKADEGMRFFAVGIGNGVSYDTVMTVSRVGRGSHDFLRDACDIGPCLSTILEKTGAAEAEYNFGDLNVEAKSITHFIWEGLLGLDGKAVQVPARERLPKLFTNERYVIYLVFKYEEPELIVFNFNGKSYTISRDDIKACSDAKIKEAHMREFAHCVDREFYLELYKRFDERVGKIPELAKKREEARLSIDDVTRAIPKDSAFWRDYKTQMQFVMRHRLLTPDTALMLGDRLESRDDWTRKGIDPIIKQYINNYSEEQGSEYSFGSDKSATLPLYAGSRPFLSSFGVPGRLQMSCVSTDGPSSLSLSRSVKHQGSPSQCAALAVQKGPRAFSRASNDPQGASVGSPEDPNNDTSCGKALLGEKEARDLLPRLLRVFDENTRETFEVLCEKVFELLAECGIDKERFANAIDAAQRNTASEAERQAKHELKSAVLERLSEASGDLLPRLLCVFDESEKESFEVLCEKVSGLLAECGIDKERFANAIDVVQRNMASKIKRHVKHELKGVIVERFLGTSNKMNASLVTYARAIAAA